MSKSLLTYGIKLAVAGLLLLLIFRSISPARAAAAAAAVPPGRLLAALLLQTACNTAAACRWHLIMRRLGFKFSFLFMLQSSFKGVFFNQGLPSSIGGDGIRILDCAKAGGSAEEAFFGVFIDRIMGLTGLLLLNIGALLMNRSLLPANVYWPLLLILSGLTAGLLLLFFLRKFPFFAAGRYLGFLGRLSERCFQVYSSVSSVSVQLGLSILVHLFSMSVFYLIGKGVGLNFPPQTYLALVPPVILLTIVPVSLAGWGVREGAMVGFFLLIGADKAKVLSLSLLCGLTALVSSLPGLAVYLTQKGESAQQG